MRFHLRYIFLFIAGTISARVAFSCLITPLQHEEVPTAFYRGHIAFAEDRLSAGTIYSGDLDKGKLQQINSSELPGSPTKIRGVAISPDSFFTATNKGIFYRKWSETSWHELQTPKVQDATTLLWRNGTLWAGSKAGIYSIRGGQSKFIDNPDKDSESEIFSIVPAGNLLLIGTHRDYSASECKDSEYGYGGSVYTLNPDTYETDRIRKSSPNGEVMLDAWPGATPGTVQIGFEGGRSAIVSVPGSPKSDCTDVPFVQYSPFLTLAIRENLCKDQARASMRHFLQEVVKSPSVTLQWTAAPAYLSFLAADKDWSTIEEAAKSESPINRSVTDFLVRWNDKQGTKLILSLLHKRINTDYTIIESLNNRNDPEIEPILKDLLERDSDETAKLYAVDTLEKQHASNLAPSIVKAMKTLKPEDHAYGILANKAIALDSSLVLRTVTVKGRFEGFCNDGMIKVGFKDFPMYGWSGSCGGFAAPLGNVVKGEYFMHLLADDTVGLKVMIDSPEVDIGTIHHDEYFRSQHPAGYHRPVVESPRKKSEKVAPKLVAMLKDNDPKSRAAAISQLHEFYWFDYTDEIIPALKDPNPSVRQQAAVYLGEHPSKKVVEPLIEALNDPDPTVRHWVAQSVGLTRNTRGLEPLKKLLSDPDERVRDRAQNGILMINLHPRTE